MSVSLAETGVEAEVMGKRQMQRERSKGELQEKDREKEEKEVKMKSKWKEKMKVTVVGNKSTVLVFFITGGRRPLIQNPSLSNIEIVT